jgi:nicotinate-nucleotide--dimethylbenzimidazole phosphoribosyltransferase
MSLPKVPPLDRAAEPGVRARLDGKAKPPGSLGRIEELAVRLALITGRDDPRMDRCRLLIFAGDHGLTAEGVSAYPSEVTAAMVATFLAGRASANAFAAAVGAEVAVVDAGVAADLPRRPGLIDAKVRKGSRNAAVEPALTPAEVETALDRGAAIAAGAAAEVDAVAVGEMGIGNSASAALLMHRLTPAPLADCVGLGAGHDAAGLARKTAALQRAAARTAARAPREVLAEFAGLEIVMMAGAILGAAAARRPVLIDGFIATAAALAAIRLQPAATDYCLFAHRSAERGHDRMLQAVDARPLLDLGLRLGEGSGALLAWPLVRAAARLLTDVASLDDVLCGRP